MRKRKPTLKRRAFHQFLNVILAPLAFELFWYVYQTRMVKHKDKE